MEHLLTELKARIAELPFDERIRALNQVRRELSEVSPFEGEPVDCVQWIPAEKVVANDYNPNTVASPEMRLLEKSITADGYTQPIVTHDTGTEYVVVDGFHRHRVGRESRLVAQRILGYLPVVRIRASQEALEDRMASTVRHNRARGKHGVEAMMDLVSHLAKRNWSDERIAKELGMDADEVLRFKQISGLAELFKGEEYSEAWEI